MDALDREKRLLRAQMKQKLAFLSITEKEEKSKKLNSVLVAAEFWPKVSSLAAFLPMPDEPDLRPLLEKALAAGKTLFLPRIDGKELVFHKAGSLENGFLPHSYGMSEPCPELPLANWAEVGEFTLFLVPGLAFDRRGGRLGRGKAFYDRFLHVFTRQTLDQKTQSQRQVLILGAAFSCQLVETLPIGETDFPLDGLVTEEEVLLVCNKKP